MERCAANSALVFKGMERLDDAKIWRQSGVRMERESAAERVVKAVRKVCVA